DREHQECKRQSWIEHDPSFARKQEVVADADQCSERWLACGYADAEEAERSFAQYGDTEVDRCYDEHRSHHVRQD
ncbi:hypothetical protein PMI10_00001, partial [Flavobacterium sp. CF136]